MSAPSTIIVRPVARPLNFPVWALPRRARIARDRWDGTTYRRIVVIEGRTTEIAVRQAGSAAEPRLIDRAMERSAPEMLWCSRQRSTHSTNRGGTVSATMKTRRTRSSWYICFTLPRASSRLTYRVHVSGMLEAVPWRMIGRSRNVVRCSSSRFGFGVETGSSGIVCMITASRSEPPMAYDGCHMASAECQGSEARPVDDVSRLFRVRTRFLFSPAAHDAN
jgi:hypothetical protein